MTDDRLEDVWRRESAHVLGALLRRYGDLADCEDAAQEALAAATTQWPVDGIPDSPRGWLIRVASRRLIDRARSEKARLTREEANAIATRDDACVAQVDDSLQLLLLCCHPALSRPSQVALTLRAVSGLTTAQVAAAYLVPEATMAQRLSRARATLQATGPHFTLPDGVSLPGRVAAVLDVCHLMFTEGYVQSSGDQVLDAALTAEAIRLVRELSRRLADHDEVAGALALMVLTEARREARTDSVGDLIPLAEQDRSVWDPTKISEGVAILERVLPRGHVGRFQIQAAVAAVHAEAPTFADTDWRQISVLYAMLEQLAPGPAVILNRAVAVGMDQGPGAGLALVERLVSDPGSYRYHRPYAVRGHLREMAGDHDGALEDYRRAACLTASRPEQRYLNARAGRLTVELGKPSPRAVDEDSSGLGR